MFSHHICARDNIGTIYQYDRDEAEANADMALNNAIHGEFAPRYRQDREEAVEQLRTFLKGND